MYAARAIYYYIYMCVGYTTPRGSILFYTYTPIKPTVQPNNAASQPIRPRTR
jgi:hypothetical protein